MNEEILKIALPLYFQNSKWYSSNVPKQLLKGIKQLSPTGKSYKTKYKLNKFKNKKKNVKSSSATDSGWEESWPTFQVISYSFAKSTSGLSEKHQAGYIFLLMPFALQAEKWSP